MQRLFQNRRFLSMAVTQFLGAFNDNVFKQLLLLLVVSTGTLWASEHPLGLTFGQALPSALFALPFVLFGVFTGSLADRYSKSRLMQVSKAMEIGVMVLALGAFQAQSYVLLLVVIFLMGTQSALFGPAKYGSIPELLPERDLSRGNAVVQSTTMLAVILGIVVGGVFTQVFGDRLWIPGLFLIGFAAAGTASSLTIGRLRPAAPERHVSWNLVREFARNWGAARGDRTIVLSIIASGFFYLNAAVLILIVNLYGAWLGLEEGMIAMLNGVTAVGVALGAILAAKISGDRIEGGLVPIGLLGMATCMFAVQIAPRSFALVGACLTGIGVCAGLFSIPVRALLQHRPAPERRGAVLGVSEVVDFLGILAASGVLFLFEKTFALEPPTMFLLLACGVLAFTFLSFLYTAEFALRLGLLVLVKGIYRVKVKGREHLPREGGALLVCNHLSFVDAFLVGAASPRPVRFMMYSGFFDLPIVGAFSRLMGTIPVSSEDTREQKRASLERAAECARNGELVCIFAEGAISRTGVIQPFARGLERIARAAEVPIVPVALDRVWGSIFSFEGGKVFWKRPQRIPYPVDVAIGEPMPAETSRFEVRNRIAELIARGREERESPRGSLAYRFVVAAKRYAGRRAVSDATGKELSYRRLLVASKVLAGRLEDELDGSAGYEERVGILLPPSVGGAVANLAVTLAGRASVNLNYTLSEDDLRDPVERAGLRHVITSRRFLEKLERGSPLPPEGTLYLEDLVESISAPRKLFTLLASFAPTFVLANAWNRTTTSKAPLTVIFSSGSTSRPKGVVLTHGNVLSNVQGFGQMISLEEDDGLLGILPFFHSFGYTVTLWGALLSGASACYLPNPLEVKRIGRVLREEQLSIVLATPTFYQSWLRRLAPEDLASARLCVAGAEKLRDGLADAWEERMGVPILEGYGCTELSPVVSLNVPDRRGLRQKGQKRGTIGRPLPGIAVRIVSLEDGTLLEPGEEGLLEVRGPSVMQGYLDEPERTAEVLRDGWYSTGDVARLDGDGFLVITDRLSRFAKIGGEMVPHGRVEDALSSAVRELSGSGPEDADVELAVTSVPDDRKGERLAVLHTPLDVDPEELLKRASEDGLPPLFAPRRGDFVEVEAIPKLGTGKTDLRALKDVARERLDRA